MASEAKNNHLDTVYQKFDEINTPQDYWFQAVGLTSDDIIEACRRKGTLTEQKEAMIKAWGYSILKPQYNIPKKTRPEMIRGSEEERNYEIAKRKDSFKKTLKDCSIAYSHKPDELMLDEVRMCNELSCKSDTSIKNESDFNEIYSGSDKQTQKSLDRCKLLNMHLCEDKDYKYKKKDYIYVPNSGIGDCLFVAYHNFLYLETEVPSAIRERRDINGLFSNETGQELNAEQPMRQAALETRSKVVNWLKLNKNKVYNPKVNGPNIFQKQECLHSVTFGALYGAKRAIIKYNKLKSIESKFKANDSGYSTIISELDIMDKYVGTKHYSDLLTLMDLIYDEYIKVMSKQNTYATQMEVDVLAIIINRPIIVLLDPSGESSSTEYVSYMASTNVHNFDNIDNAIFIKLNSNFDRGDAGNHYEVLYPLKGTGVTSDTISLKSTIASTKCPECTFENPKGTKKCQICDFKLEPKKNVRPVPKQKQKVEPIKECLSCSYHNKSDSDKCEMCETPLNSQANIVCKKCSFINNPDEKKCGICSSKLQDSKISDSDSDSDSDMVMSDTETDSVGEAIKAHALNIGIKCHDNNHIECLERLVKKIQTNHELYEDIIAYLIEYAKIIIDDVDLDVDFNKESIDLDSASHIILSYFLE